MKKKIAAVPLIALMVALLMNFYATESLHAQTTTIWIVRHGEKDTALAQRQDPNLSAAGQQRAKDLFQQLRSQQPTIVYSTERKRTRQTVAHFPAAKQLVIYDSKALPSLAEKILTENKGATILVVGHSNTLLETIEALGGKRPVPELTEDDYDYLFKVEIDPKGIISVTYAHYGTPHHGGGGAMISQ
ncbi:MAG: histidine phosphatase family protein [Sediminibacterium sp.]|nr:histidine phosphatase family protein [Sediminibacterium sp.]